MFEDYKWGVNPVKDEYHLARLNILKRMLNGEITKEQADALGSQIDVKYRPLIEKENQEQKTEYERKMNELYSEPSNAWEDIGYRRSSEEKDYSIPSSAKSVTKHRSACGVKLSDKDISRFWNKINVKGANDCWPWKNSTRGSLGYGQFRIGDRICDAHRIALELMSGPLKKGKYILHNCDNPKCCNPRHLSAGTQKGNMDDMTDKGRGDN